MNEFTATRSMRFVVALYSTLSVRLPADGDSGSATTDSCLQTRGESSGSTWIAFRAVVASRSVGRGKWRSLAARRCEG